MAIVIPISLLVNVFGILGTVVSFFVYLAPLPTFRRIYKKKSTEGFQSIPYSVALFSAMLLLYYGSLKQDKKMIILTINSIGCTIETAYIIFYLIYATKESKIYTMKLIGLFNIGAYGLIVTSTSLLTERKHQAVVVGWICAVFSVCVFAAPLSIMRRVIKTKSVEYMPFFLSFFLTICAIMWFFYGLLIKDYFVATPNILGFGFGITQMIIYVIYKDKKKQVLPISTPEVLKKVEQELGTVLEMKEKTVDDGNNKTIIVVAIVETTQERCEAEVVSIIPAEDIMDNIVAEEEKCEAEVISISKPEEKALERKESELMITF